MRDVVEALDARLADASPEDLGGRRHHALHDGEAFSLDNGVMTPLVPPRLSWIGLNLSSLAGRARHVTAYRQFVGVRHQNQRIDLVIRRLTGVPVSQSIQTCGLRITSGCVLR